MVDQMKEGQRLFYEGLEQLGSSALQEALEGGEEPRAAAAAAKEVVINGVKVTMVDTVDGVGSTDVPPAAQMTARNMKLSFVEDGRAGGWEEGYEESDAMEGSAGNDGGEASTSSGDSETIDLEMLEEFETAGVGSSGSHGDSEGTPGDPAGASSSGLRSQEERYMAELLAGQEEELSRLMDSGGTGGNRVPGA